MAIKAEYINPFLTSAVSVINTMAGETPVKSEVVIQKVNFKSAGFSAIVGIAEGGKGRILLDMEKVVAVKIAEAINGEEFGEINNDVITSIAEVANMIAGNGITQINNLRKGLNLRLTPPSIFAGDDLEINSPKLSSVGVKFKLSYGELSMNIAFEGMEE